MFTRATPEFRIETGIRYSRRMSSSNISANSRIEILRALAYLFQHPEIDSRVELLWNATEKADGTQSYTFVADKKAVEGVLILLAGTALRPVKLPMRQRYGPTQS